jgi:hypothetical protein
MNKDVIDKITFSVSNSSVGELTFTYLQNIDHVGNKFAEPRRKSSKWLQQKSQDILWLVQLAGGDLNE